MAGAIVGLSSGIPRRTTSLGAKAAVGAGRSASEAGQSAGRLSEAQFQHLNTVAKFDHDKLAPFEQNHRRMLETANQRLAKDQPRLKAAKTPEERTRILARMKPAMDQRMDAKKALEQIQRSRQKLSTMSDQVLANPHIRPEGSRLQGLSA